MNTELWPHQADAISALKDTVRQGVKRVVMQAPCGAGKTMMAAAVVDGAIRKGNRMAFVVPKIALVDQTVEAFYEEGITDVGVIQANHRLTDWSKPVQVCSIQTLRSRGAYPEAKVVVFDECHELHEHHKTWLTDEAWKGVPFIGLSATPWTRGLGKYFDTLIVAATTQELIDLGRLSKFKAFATGHPDLRGVKTVAGDYHEGQLSGAMQEGTLVADVVETWKEKWGKDKTLCFGVDCAHAQALQKRFQSAGIPCGYQDAFTPGDERAEIKRKFHSGAYRVVCNVGTLTTGVDWDVRCLILARPTKSEILFVQIIGRALRTAEGKDHAIILDHSDTTLRLGFVTDIHHEHLDGGLDKPPAEKSEPLPKECKACGFLKPPRTRVCPNCGFEAQPVNGIFEKEGELVEVVPGQGLRRPKGGVTRSTMEDKAKFYAELKGYGRDSGKKTGWAAHTFREKFGVWPDWSIKNVEPTYAKATTLAWIRERTAAWVRKKMETEAAVAKLQGKGE